MLRYTKKGEAAEKPIEVSIEVRNGGEYVDVMAGSKFLVRLTSDGRLMRFRSANCPGLQTDDFGRIKLCDDEVLY